MDIKDMKNMGSDDFETHYLRTRGIINHHGSIDSYDAVEIAKSLDVIDLVRESGWFIGDKICLRLWASPGGDAEAAIAIHDLLRAYHNRTGLPIQIEIYGYAASAAAMIVLQAGDVRVAAPNASFLLHEVREFVFLSVDKASDIADKKVGMDLITDKVYSIIAERTGHDKDEVADFIDRREAWMSIDEAFQWNLIDGTIE